MDSHKVPFRVEATRLAFTHAMLFQVARFSLKQAEGKVEGSFHNRTSSMVFSAFTLEAYLNHVGQQLVPEWEEFAPSRKKLNRILQQLNFIVDFSARPFSSFAPLFEFRNILAHGRTQELFEQREEYLTGNELIFGPEIEWERRCTSENARWYLDDTRAMIAAIHQQAGLPYPALGFLGFTGGSAAPIEEE